MSCHSICLFSLPSTGNVASFVESMSNYSEKTCKTEVNSNELNKHKAHDSFKTRHTDELHTSSSIVISDNNPDHIPHSFLSHVVDHPSSDNAIENFEQDGQRRSVEIRI